MYSGALMVHIMWFACVWRVMLHFAKGKRANKSSSIRLFQIQGSPRYLLVSISHIDHLYRKGGHPVRPGYSKVRALRECQVAGIKVACPSLRSCHQERDKSDAQREHSAQGNE